MNSKNISCFKVVLILVVSLLFPIKSFADWAYAFVVWDDYVYVITTERVDKIDKKLGHVTKYSDREGNYSGNFSNTYLKGTKYYSIQGVSTDEAIAIQEKGETYIKAVRDGEYAGNKYGLGNLGSPVFLGGTLFVAFILMIGSNQFLKRRAG